MISARFNPIQILHTAFAVMASVYLALALAFSPVSFPTFSAPNDTSQSAINSDINSSFTGNNRLNHDQLTSFIEEMEACASQGYLDTECAVNVKEEYAEISASNSIIKSYSKLLKRNPSSADPKVVKQLDEILENSAPKRGPTFRIGDSDGGPGAWTRVNESMSDAQRAYQQRVTGAPNGTAYNVTDVNVASGRTSFDGYNPQTNTLIDAKCWTCWPNNSLSFSNQSVVDQAFRQQRVAQQTGRTVEWHVPDQAAATRVQNAFATTPQSQRIDPNTIRVVVTPQ